MATALWPGLVQAENFAKEIKKAVELSTLNQPGTKPFHLKAVLSPSLPRDKDSGRSGEIEIWWASPTRWRRELRSPEFHQTEIVDAQHDWQKNEGSYFPQWLQQTAVELINPIPPLDEVLKQINGADVQPMGRMTHLSWTTPSGTAEVKTVLRTSIAFDSAKGLLLYAFGLGWGADFSDYTSFRGRMVPQTVKIGSPELTAKVVTLEGLPEMPPEFFDITGKGGDEQPLRTEVIGEPILRNNLEPTVPVSWPPLQDGTLEGNATTQMVVDRQGKIREMSTVISENSAINETARQAFATMQFKPFIINGVPVQVLSQVVLHFKTTRPVGSEVFESPRTYFERGRHASFPAAGNGTPYVLHAEFDARGNAGTVEKGRYEDTWLSDTQWRREVWFEKSHFVRSRNGDKAYLLEEGPEAPLLRLVLRLAEPIPAIDTLFESDWKIKRDTVDGVRTVRVLAGYESPAGKLDPEMARGFWFDDSGVLVRTFFKDIETRRLEFSEFAGVKLARRIDVLKDGKLAMRIRVTEVGPAAALPAKMFEVHGHDWKRAFTDEVR
jgi:hypothetical protein